LRALVHAIVPNEPGDAWLIIGENLAAAFCLREAAFVCASPRVHGRFVSEKREREDLPRLIEALQRSIDMKPSIFSSNGRSSAAIVVLAFGSWPHF
jgi:hypothetical protein